MSALISLEGVSKRFGYRTILNQIRFEVHEGESVLLLGNNGAGKSTLLRLISSLSRPTSGRLCYRGQPYADCHLELLANLGVLSHESRFYPDLSAEENLRLYGRLYQVHGLSQKVPEVLEEVRLSHVQQAPVRTFSSGMTKRLMIARLMLYQPRLLLLDEPYTGLDQTSVSWLQQWLREHVRAGGSLLLVTHQLELGLAVSNRVLLLHQQALRRDRPVDAVSLEECASWLNDGVHHLPAEG
ncbi:MAG: heme ABC exporter ATP-binding protein CcmA [bacterium]